MRTLLCLVMFLLSTPVVAEVGPLAAEDPGDVVQVIVDRREDELTVYISIRATELPRVFGVGADALLDDDGTVSIDKLYGGTFTLADAVWTGVETRLGDQPVALDGLSLMVHDPEFLPRFSDPWDAEGAIAVCTSPETVDGLSLSPLRAYLGYYAWKVDATQPLEITLPTTGREALSVEMRQYWNYQPIGVQMVTVADGGTLVLRPNATPSLMPILLAVLAMGVFALGAITVLRRRPQPA